MTLTASRLRTADIGVGQNRLVSVRRTGAVCGRLAGGTGAALAAGAAV